jgi:hypothetical protein
MTGRIPARFGRGVAVLLIGGVIGACGMPGPTMAPMPSGASSVDIEPIPTPSPRTAAASEPATGSESPPASDARPEPPLTGVIAVMLDTIRNDRPTARFDLTPDRLDGSWVLDGNADDGFGSGRLYVVVDPRPGDLLAHPCGDPEFRQGARCIEQELPGGDRLSLRDRVSGGGVTSVLAVVIHPDRSGITAESSTLVIDLDAGPLGPGPRGTPVVGRWEPMYSPADLGRLLLAIDRRLTGA